MLRQLLVVFLFSVTSFAAADKVWVDGKVVSIEKTTESHVTNDISNALGQIAGKRAEPERHADVLVFLYTIEVQDRTYVAKTNVRSIELGAIQLSTDKIKIYLKDSKGKEHKMDLVKETLR